METDKETRIRQRAYEIWEREGRPEGRDAEHWQRAEREVEAERETADAALAEKALEAPASATPPPPRRRSRAVPEGSKARRKAEEP